MVINGFFFYYNSHSDEMGCFLTIKLFFIPKLVIFSQKLDSSYIRALSGYFHYLFCLPEGSQYAHIGSISKLLEIEHQSLPSDLPSIVQVE